MEYSILFVCLLGMGIVFLGLICLILLTFVIGAFWGTEKKQESSIAQPDGREHAEEPLLQEVVAAISAVIAEETGSELSNIRISSVRKV